MSLSLDIPGSENDGPSKINLETSSIDPGALLLRLAGKPVNKKGDNNEEKKESAKKTKSKVSKPKKAHPRTRTKSKPVTPMIPRERKNSEKPVVQVPVKVEKSSSTVNVPEDEPDWDMMDESNLSTFRDLFNQLDQSNTGIITADNLYEELQRVDSEITYSEVEEVLRKVDKDGNGEIDFDEFLHHMTLMGGDLFGDDGGVVDEEKKKKNSRRQRFFSALNQFAIKQTLADIEKQFRKQAPHVISHYTAGVRLIGLTTRQLEREMKRMQKTADENDSPYAKPLQFVHMGAKTIVQRKRVKKKCIPDRPKSCRDLQKSEEVTIAVSDDPTVANLSKEIKETMKIFASKKGFASKAGDANLLMQLRQKIGTVTAQLQIPLNPEHTKNKSVTDIKRQLFPVPEAGQTKKQKSGITIRSIPPDEGKKKKEGKKKPMGWATPRILYIEVPLPSLKMKSTSEKPTFNDLHRIRAKAKESIDGYYHNLRSTQIRNAWDHWDRLYADVIQPKKLLENFRTVYSAYSPHREEDAFVVCPWKPGPFRYIRHIKTGQVRSLSNSPDITLGRLSPKPFPNFTNLAVRPYSS